MASVPRLEESTRYEIRISGELSHDWGEWFGGLELAHITDEQQRPVTLLTGKLDQSALHGVLVKIFSLNLFLISVRWQPETPDQP